MKDVIETTVSNNKYVNCEMKIVEKETNETTDFVNENKTMRGFVLDEANKIVNCDRNEQYGEPEDNFATIAKLWGAYLDAPIDPMDVAIMMTLFKIGRIEAYPDKADSWIDAAGYIACGAEIALK